MPDYHMPYMHMRHAFVGSMLVGFASKRIYSTNMKAQRDALNAVMNHEKIKRGAKEGKMNAIIM